MMKAPVQGEDAAAVAVGGAVLRRRSHLIQLCRCWSNLNKTNLL